jgi:hypothetical protein
VPCNAAEEEEVTGADSCVVALSEVVDDGTDGDDDVDGMVVAGERAPLTAFKRATCRNARGREAKRNRALPGFAAGADVSFHCAIYAGPRPVHRLQLRSRLDARSL